MQHSTELIVKVTIWKKKNVQCIHSSARKIVHHLTSVCLPRVARFITLAWSNLWFSSDSYYTSQIMEIIWGQGVTTNHDNYSSRAIGWPVRIKTSCYHRNISAINYHWWYDACIFLFFIHEESGTLLDVWKTFLVLGAPFKDISLKKNVTKSSLTAKLYKAFYLQYRKYVQGFKKSVVVVIVVIIVRAMHQVQLWHSVFCLKRHMWNFKSHPWVLCDFITGNKAKNVFLPELPMICVPAANHFPWKWIR